MAAGVKWAAGVVLILAVLAAGFYRWPISSALVAKETDAQLGQSVGLELRPPGRARFNLLPTPTLRLVDVELRGQNDATILTAPEATVRLSLGALVFGRFEAVAASLLRPTILLDFDSHPLASDSAISTTIATQTADRVSAPLGAVQVRDGLLHIVSAAHQVDTLLEDVSAALDWPRLQDPLRLTVRARWRDAPLSVETTLAQPADLMKGGRSELHFWLGSAQTKVNLDGAVMAGSEPRFEGAVSAEAASLAAVRGALSLPDGSALADGPISLTSKAAAGVQGLTLSEMRLALVGGVFEGAAAIGKASDRISISSTLATDELALGTLLANARAPFGPTGDWGAAPLNFAALSRFDFDLRISAARVAWRGRPLEDAAIELIDKEGRLKANLVEASAYGGVLKAEFSLTPQAPGFAAHASGSLADADLGALCADFGFATCSGQGGGGFAFEAIGESPAALVRAAEGKATIQLSAGAIDGVSFEEALRRSERHPIDLFNDMRVGRTVFTQAAATLALAKGEKGALNASLIGPGVNLTMAGSVDVVARQVSLHATATQTDAAGAPKSKGPRFDFEVMGPWSGPTLKPFVGGG